MSISEYYWVSIYLTGFRWVLPDSTCLTKNFLRIIHGVAEYIGFYLAIVGFSFAFLVFSELQSYGIVYSPAFYLLSNGGAYLPDSHEMNIGDMKKCFDFDFFLHFLHGRGWVEK